MSTTVNSSGEAALVPPAGPADAPVVTATSYARSACVLGVVHVGFGAFHRAHQAVYFDDYMAKTGDLSWGIGAVNLRPSDRENFQAAVAEIARNDGYYMQNISAEGAVTHRRVRSHIDFADWHQDPARSQGFLAQASVHLVTITITESGYYAGPDARLDLSDREIVSEVTGGKPHSIYGYLRAGLSQRMAANGAPITIACCDNMRRNGKMLRANLMRYLTACGDVKLATWVAENVAFPCSMVDRITPRSPASLGPDLSAALGRDIQAPVMAEAFTQWVIEATPGMPMPDLEEVGVTVTQDLDPYEETKIRVLNGGHTALTYLAALEGIHTFDAAMRAPHLYDHFQGFQTGEVLPALNRDLPRDLPFDTTEYLGAIDRRFKNRAIGDTIARICADGMAKFPLFIRPTLEGCFNQNITPNYAIRSIASWAVFAQHVAADRISFKYVDPRWDELKTLLETDEFVTAPVLWGDIPVKHPAFVERLRAAITELELKWPI